MCAVRLWMTVPGRRDGESKNSAVASHQRITLPMQRQRNAPSCGSSQTVAGMTALCQICCYGLSEVNQHQGLQKREYEQMQNPKQNPIPGLKLQLQEKENKIACVLPVG